MYFSFLTQVDFYLQKPLSEGALEWVSNWWCLSNFMLCKCQVHFPLVCSSLIHFSKVSIWKKFSSFEFLGGTHFLTDFRACVQSGMENYHLQTQPKSIVRRHLTQKDYMCAGGKLYFMALSLLEECVCARVHSLLVVVWMVNPHPGNCEHDLIWKKGSLPMELI